MTDLLAPSCLDFKKIAHLKSKSSMFLESQIGKGNGKRNEGQADRPRVIDGRL